MKLPCQVEVINRMHSTLNIRSNGKYLKSTLAIGKEPKNEKEYFIMHFSTVNKSGTRYKVKNIKQVFTRCLKEGKATIRFQEPDHDLCIKSEPIQLRCFMNVLKSCVSGDKDVKITNLSNISIVAKEIVAPTKLVIDDRSKFPSSGFPRTLESLHITGLKLCNFRRDILLLKHLVLLDLSNNEIEKIPVEFGRMTSLCELNLSNNNIGIKSTIDWRWLLGPQITKKLKLLDLTGNKLTYLPKAIWKLQNLITLKLDNNKIEKLPATIGRISSLRYLTISKNELSSLPCSLMQCHLEYIDLSANKFRHKESIQSSKHTPWEYYIGNLVHLSSKVVLKYKINYASNIIPGTLVEFLDNANMCMCGAPVLSDYLYVIKPFSLKDFFRSVVFDNNLSSIVDFECYFCSSKCLIK